MTHDASATPQDESEKPNSLDAATGNDVPILASLVDPHAVRSKANLSSLSEQDSAIRMGSPFAREPEPPEQPARAEDVFFQATPLRYTSIGAVAAATLVVLFALGGTIWFPTGGTLVAGLGCLLSILGLYSHQRVAAASLLAIHLVLFVASYSRVFV
mgnify:CR=1 FL=1|tara:strand:+ start:131 stop:601 length:471 start_codon:yes stop_codon:yes gene_type:complete